MKTQRAPFQPLDSDLDDGKLEKLAQRKGVGVLVKPDAAEGQGEQGGETVQVPAPITQPEPLASRATPRSRMKTLNVELPEYVWTELKIRAAQRQTSLRHVIMSALTLDGITITDADMVEDGRRLRGRTALPH